jgi:DNA-binding MarR family transcriptional regulator
MDAHIPQIDRFLSIPGKFGIICYLAAANGGEATFGEIAASSLNDNRLIRDPSALSRHYRQLEAEGYVEARRSFVGTKPQTLLILTPKGWQRFRDHCAALNAIGSTAPEANVATS